MSWAATASGRAAFMNDSGVESTGLGAQWCGEERSLVLGDTCARVSKDRMAQAFGEFPVVLSLTSTQGRREDNERTSCVLITWPLLLI